MAVVLLVGSMLLFYAVITKSDNSKHKIIACLEQVEIIPLKSRSVKFEILGDYILFATIEPYNRMVVYDPCKNEVVKSIEIK